MDVSSVLQKHDIQKDRLRLLIGCCDDGGNRWDWLEATTGPVMLYNAVQVYKRVKGMSGLTLLKPGVIYPIDWRHTVWGPKDGTGAPSCTVT